MCACYCAMFMNLYDPMSTFNSEHNGTHKINTDGSWRPAGKASGGGVIRTHTGAWVAGFSCKLYARTVASAELKALKEGLLLARRLGLSNIIVETDAQELVDHIDHARDMEHHDLYPIIRDVAIMINDNLWSVRLAHIPRGANLVAHDLASYAMGMNVNRKDYMDVPECAASAFQFDLSSIKD